MRKLIRKRFYNIVLILIALIAIGFFMTHTETGARWTLTIASKIIPGQLNLQGIQGRLAGPLKIQTFSYHNKQTQIAAENINITWKPLDLLFAKLSIQQLTASNINIQLASDKTPSREDQNVIKDIMDYRLPLAIDIQNSQFNNINISYNGLAKPVKISSLIFATRASHWYLNYAKIKLISPNAYIDIDGHLYHQYSLKWDIKINRLSDLIPDSSGTIITKGQFSGTKNNPKVNGTFAVNNLTLFNNTVGSIRSNIALDLTNQQTSTISLIVKDFAAEAFAVNQFGFNATIRPTSKEGLAGAKVNIELVPGTLSIPTNYANYAISLQKGNINAIINKGGIFSKIILYPKHENPVNAYLNIKNFKTIDGLATWKSTNFAFLDTLLPETKKTRGSADAQIRFLGTLKKPKFTTNITVRNVTTYVPIANIHPRVVYANVTGDNKQLNYKATVQSGKGTLDLTATTLVQDPHFLTKIQAQGKNLLLSNTDNIKIIATPKLNADLSTQKIDVNGDIFIPEANIEPPKFTSIDTLPDELVFVRAKNGATITRNSPFGVSLNINLALGNNIKINVKGLKGYLAGNLKINQTPQATTATGALYIKDGSYNIYGQDLKITQGKLTFSNSPLENPFLDITAIRDFKGSASTSAYADAGTLTVGAHIQGQLSKPQTTLFSTPIVLSNQDILSYLVLGEPTSQLGEDKLNLLVRAAQALSSGTAGGTISHVTDAIKAKLGLATLGLESEASLDEVGGTTTTTTSLVVGKYLTPRLYVGYGFNIFDQTSTARIRYRLWRSLYLQTEGSTDNNMGGDLIYSFNKK